MSVINQMLKDLEQRSPESITHAKQSDNVIVAQSPIKIAAVTAVCVLAICLVSFYVWQLISENNALKAEQIIHSANVTKMSAAEANTTEIKSVEYRPEAIDSQVNVAKKIRANENKNDKVSGSIQVANAVGQLGGKKNNQQQKVLSNAQVIEPSNISKALSNNRTETMAQTIAAKPLVSNNASQVTPAKKGEVITDIQSHSADTSGHSHTVPDIVKSKSKAQSNTNKMSVSRRQLSADELAEQKLTLAEKALAAKQIKKAEKLLEDVVIIRPSDSQTRKKLAALWFGRQAYQDAVNLLSQGIALNGRDSSLRQMKARIHLKQGQFTEALNTLKPLAQLKDEQYQVMLANTAQQAQQNKVAVDAYKMLIAMKPEIGRWQLGLAVLYDKSSQFDLASMAYKKSLTKNDLSISSENFVKQRIQVIGQ